MPLASDGIVTLHRRHKSVNSFKARTKRKIVENMKKSAEGGKKTANEGLTLEEIKQRDLEAIKEKQRAFEERQAQEGGDKKKKKK